MATQTDYVNSLQQRMNEAFEKEFYLESITCSFAIIENRIKRICEHLEIGKKGSLDQCINGIYNKMQNTDSEQNINTKMIKYLNYFFKENGLISINENESFQDWKENNNSFNNEEHKHKNKLMYFKKIRNGITHELATYNPNIKELPNFNDNKEFAQLGKYIENKLCRVCSNIKSRSFN